VDDPTTPPARKAGLGAPVESPTTPSPDVEVLIKKIAELRAEQGWWIEFSSCSSRTSVTSATPPGHPAPWTGTLVNRFSG